MTKFLATLWTPRGSDTRSSTKELNPPVTATTRPRPRGGRRRASWRRGRRRRCRSRTARARATPSTTPTGTGCRSRPRSGTFSLEGPFRDLLGTFRDLLGPLKKSHKDIKTQILITGQERRPLRQREAVPRAAQRAGAYDL